MKLVGIDNVEYRNPNARHEKVYDTYLKIENPFRTEDVDSSFADSFLEWYDSQDSEKYERETANADMWDKNNITAEEWVENKLRDDIENGTSRAWTMIPDAVTDFLKSLGYDGIFDAGGKGGGESHTVYIPFSSSQIKSAEAVTYDDNGDVIPLNKRFDLTKSDIRFSFQSVDKKNKTEYNKRKKKGSYYNEQETQFNIWQNSASTPVGAMKAFTRFDKKIHFYQKIKDGCIEIAEWEFNERKYSEYVEDLERAKTRVNVLSPSNGNGGRRNSKYDSVYRYAGTDTGNDFGSEGEGLQNEQSGNLERGRGDSEETSEIKLSLQETAQAGEVKEKLIQENDNLRVANKLLKSEMQLTKGRMIPFDCLLKQ
ncbi:MAG: hypothetical protein IKW03_00530 [Clostridia bacterium]|nr:hypothetical protein [Clostridia bacterium]